MTGRAVSTSSVSCEDHHALTETLLRKAAEHTGACREELLREAIVQGAAMARSLALRYDGRGVDREELFQVAYVGLVKAAQGYRPGPDTDFRSYAFPTIRGEIKRHFRDNAWAVRPPRRIQNLQASINAVEGELAAQLHRWPTDQELADRIGVPVEEIRDAQRAVGCFHPASLDASLWIDSSVSLGSTVPDRADTFELVNQLETLRPAVANLGERDKLILRRRMVDHWSQAEIAAEIGVSQMQVSRLLSRIMGVLRSALAA
ncbi:sigma-70 family RNA polymerase sigma factor [Kribbella pittospori]|uniref:Sigma-70 family RNA polymerase sigma factor n=1 Tax=Kribbella pittospori TaxID=722689 RepID=A0A4V2MA35_9ACTN|nr:sigma-70 family RNA polymerase sigma factor [Kribbella pittospori]TCC57752.1 sigma-70 family RNA polymerase sigma factor [Kribbella pittospori]